MPQRSVFSQAGHRSWQGPKRYCSWAFRPLIDGARSALFHSVVHTCGKRRFKVHNQTRLDAPAGRPLY